MRKIILGKTKLEITKTAFGALPIQRLSTQDAIQLLKQAKENGINFYDTAREYTDSENKIGAAFEGCRNEIVIATKTHASTLDEMKKHVNESLEALRTDYIDLYQFHNPASVPAYDSPMYQYMLELKEQGIIRHIGISCHSYAIAAEAIECELYETLQYPIFCLSDEKDLGLIEKCKQQNMGIIAMKGMGGGLIDDARVAFLFFEHHMDVCTIWGMQKQEELDEFTALDQNPPIYNKKLAKKLEEYRDELKGDFCRSCGYCMSACPVNIQILNCARMTQLLKRAVWQDFVSEEWQQNMEHTVNCIECGACTLQCPYNLDIPSLLKKNLKSYREFLNKKQIKG